MLQEQIVDYAKTQLKLAVSKDAIKSALLGAGWPAADIDDSLKNLDVATASPISFSAPKIEEKKPQAVSQPSVLSISDLMGDSKSKQMQAITNSSTKKPEKTIELLASTTQKKMDMSKSHNVDIRSIILGIVALLAVGGSVYFFLQNQSAQNKLADLSGQLDAANASTASLNARVNDLTAQNNNLNSKVDTLTGENAQLSSELFFLITPQSLNALGTIDFSLKGTVAGGDKVAYTVTSSDGIKVSIKNSKDAKVDAALKALIGKEVKIAGTHATGSREVTITSVNDSSIQ